MASGFLLLFINIKLQARNEMEGGSTAGDVNAEPP